jgi:O-antigen/teichoic acid export membrane protein
VLKIDKSKQLTVNIICSIVSYGLSLLVSFFLSPYIIKTVGIEANGFITLANNFVTYASVLTIALNSMSSRFVTVELERGNREGANTFYNSILWASIMICCTLAAVSVPLLLFLEKVILIPSELIADVKLLFLFIFLNFMFSILSSTFAVATFATNRLYLTSLRTMESQILRVILLLVVFSVFTPHVYLVGIATVTATAYVMLMNLRYRRKLLPQLTLDRRFIKLRALWTVVSSGLWNTVIRLGQILSNSLSALIANLLISPTAMGVVSLSLTISSAASGLVSAIASVFTPDLTRDVAHGNFDGMMDTVKRAIKIMSSIVNIPMIVVLINGDQFFSLWTPSQDAKLLWILSSMSLGCLLISGGINVLYSLFTALNKLKYNALTVLLNGIVTVLVTLVLLKTTKLGLFAIVATSELVNLTRVLAFVVPYGSKCMGRKWYELYPVALKPLIPAALCFGLGMALKRVFPVHSWMTYILFSGVLAVLALFMNIFIILNREDRKAMVRMIAGKLKR